MTTNNLELKLQNILQDGLDEKAYSCYAAAVGKGQDIYFKSSNTTALFDIASLTKVIGTAMVTLKLVEAGKISLSDTLSTYFKDCCGKDKISIYQLITHTSGITAHFPLWKSDLLPEESCNRILQEPLVCQPGSQRIYSCMGYILLGFILEQVTGMTLDNLVSDLVLNPLEMDESFFCPPTERICVPTENVCGTVHDENAAFLGGVSGNAGLFCSFEDTIKFAQMLSGNGKDFLSPDIFNKAITEGLGFQIYHSGSFPVGNSMSPGSFGHTGFTGTALYVDKSTGIYTILLTNRICYGRENTKGLTVRRNFYTTVYENLKEFTK